jgi:hypothetical protein
MEESAPSLTPGAGFHLDAQGQWEVKDIPPEVLKVAEFSGYLTIHGYRASVFETPDGDQWAQKSVNTPATASSAVFVPRSRRRNAMGPKQTSDWLRKIATKLDSTPNPNKSAVIADLKWVLANMDAPPPQEQTALPQSGAGKGLVKKLLSDAMKAADSGDDATFKSILEKLNKQP